jgi:flagellar capping protein FliD
MQFPIMVIFVALLSLEITSASWSSSFLSSSSSSASVEAAAANNNNHVAVTQPASTASEANRIQRLHKAFDITDPNEDIRTNILLNMEGI